MAEETKMEEKAPEAPKQETTTTTTSTSTTTKKSGSSKTVVIVIVALLLLCCCVIIGAAGYYFFYASRSVANLGGNLSDVIQNSVTNSITNSTGSTGSDGSSITVNLPSGFPSDVPIYPGAKILFGVKNDTDSYSASLTSTASAGTVTDYYKAEIVKKGWTIKNEGNIFGYVITAEKDSRELNVVVIDIKDDNGNPVQSITLSVAPKN